MAFDQEIERPPLPAWPREVLDHEPAHGLFKRLASANHQISTRTLAATVGVNGRHPDPHELLEFCRRFPIAGLEKLDVSTPRIAGRLVEICGQTFSRRDWTLAQPRVCPGCIAESRHHRTWFDLTLLRRCPTHDEPLIDSVGEDKLAAWFPGIGVTPDGAVARPADRWVQADRGRSWEAYVLGRMGIVAGFEVPALDGYELFEIVEAADLLAGVKALVTGVLSSQSARTASVRAADVASGFNLLSGREAAMEGVIRNLLGLGRGRSKSTAIKASARSWLNFRLAKLSSPGLASLIRGALRRVSREHGLIPRRARVCTPLDPLTLSEAAKALSLDVDTMRRLAVRLRYIDPKVRRGRVYQIAPAAVEEMRETLATIVARERVSEMVGVWEPGFDALCRRANVKPVIRIGGISPAYDRFHPDDLERLKIAGDQVRDETASTVARAHACEVVGVLEARFDELCRQARIKPVVRLGGPTAAFDRFSQRDLERLVRGPKPAPTRRVDRVSSEGLVTLHEAAATLGLEVETARRLAIRLRHIDARANFRGCQFKPVVVKSMHKTLEMLVPRDRAREVIGALKFDELCRVNRIKPFIRIGGSSPACDRFHPRDLERVQASRARARA